MCQVHGELNWGELKKLHVNVTRMNNSLAVLPFLVYDGRVQG